MKKPTGSKRMPDNFDTCLAFTLKEEGGYSDDPADPGGATNMGITLATYRQWSDNPSLGALQVQDLSERTARAIYRSLYWNPLRADALPAGVDLSVFDTAEPISSIPIAVVIPAASSLLSAATPERSRKFEEQL
jgi:lysozyme family protein